jgi:tetratricopeptide (TPR) repeat protein
MPPGVRHNLLVAQYERLSKLGLDDATGRQTRLSWSYSAEAQAIFDRFEDRQNEGRECEARGDTGKAIQLYERSVAERCSSWMPYERLRIIYCRQKDYDKAAKVCEQYIATRLLLGEASAAEMKRWHSWMTELKATAEKAQAVTPEEPPGRS